jgi:hypothetical protein
MFAANVPALERLIRIMLGLGFALFAWFGLAPGNAGRAAIGLCFAATGLIGFCPACALVGRRLKPRR